MRYQLYVPNISCNHCKMRISKKLDQIGVKEYQVDVPNRTVFVKTDDLKIITDALEEIGYPVQRFERVAD